MSRSKLIRRAACTSIGIAMLLSLSVPAVASAADATPLVISQSTLQELDAYIVAHDDTYGGIVFDTTTEQYVVTQVQSAALNGLPSLKSLVDDSLKNANVQATTTGATVRLAPVSRKVQRSMKQLLQLRDDIRFERAPSGPASSATYWAVNPGSNKVIVGLEKPVTPELEDQARERYGDAVELRQVPHFTTAVGTLDLGGKALKFVDALQTVAGQAQSQQSAAAATYTRLNDDPAAFSSGNRISFLAADRKSGNFCSTAWMYVSSRHIFTAGHCFSTGATVYQGMLSCTTVCSVPGPGVIGTVYTRQWGDNRPDWEGITAASGKGIARTTYIGGSSSSSRTAQGTMYNAAFLNETVCSDGSVTGFSCAKITATEGCAKVDVYVVCGLEAMQSTNGQRIVQHGDSGGPVRSSSNSGGYGVISGGNPDQGGTYLLFSTWRSICAVAKECSPQ